ncbi:hypothetical protein K2P47_00255 [Patescibacteria group bacterium]|nr:hypothetical protein [Patescibacteria group bacterium]
MNKFFYISTILASLVTIVTWFYLQKLESSPATVTTVCPTESNFEQFWNDWSYQYLTDNPDVDIDTQMEDWNTLVVLHDCGEEWLNPLDEMIKEHGASGTPVYWYDTP